MKILEKILKDLSSDEEVVSTLLAKPDLWDLHFTLGLRIRNRYLWGNEKTAKALMKHYGVTHIDDVSSKIILDLIDRLQAGK